MVIAPTVVLGTAVLDEEPPPMLTESPDTVYVHVMPASGSFQVSALVPTIAQTKSTKESNIFLQGKDTLPLDFVDMADTTSNSMFLTNGFTLKNGLNLSAFIAL
jgi:hypothetical protein